MKKLLLATTTALVLTSCVNDEVKIIESKDKPNIVYKTSYEPRLVDSIASEGITNRGEQMNIASTSGMIKEKTVSVLEANTNSRPDVKVRAIETISTSSVPTTPVKRTVVQPTEYKTTTVTNYGSSESSPEMGDANVGQCYGKVKVAGTFKTIQEQVVVKPESTRTKTIPAKYNYVTDEVVTREEGVKFIEIPARYQTVQETVVVEPEKAETITIPAKYRTVTERVMVSPARKVWQKGRGLIERKGNDGEIMCLVEEPAKYQNVQKKVIVENERQETRVIPAKTRVITKQIVAEPARVEKQIIPAVKSAVSRKVVSEPERTVEINVPAEYKTITKKVPVTQDKVVWKPVLCDYNITRDIILKIQEALVSQGYNVGDVDGIFGSRTEIAINKYQKSLGIESSGITLETLKRLGVYY